MKKILISILIFLASTTTLWGACSWNGNIGTAASLAVADVQACINDAGTKTGEVTINLPAGTATWASYPTVNMSSGFANVTSLRIFGAGTIPTGTTKGSASSGGTTINVTASSAIIITGSTSKKFRIANIHWTGGVNNTGYFIRFNGTSLPSSSGGFRVDHNTFTDFVSRVRKVTTQGRIYGVIDHNYVYGPSEYNMFGDVGESSGYGGNRSWYRGIDINGIDQVYFEDNEVVNTLSTQYSFFTDCVNGGRLVARYNTITNYYFGGHGLGGMRSCLSQVIHNNTMYTTDVSVGGADPSFSFRDGTAIVYNNTITETRSGSPVTNSMWANPIIVRDYRSAFNVCTNYAESWNHGSPHDLDCDGDAASLARKVCYNNILEQPKTCTSDSDCGTGAPENSCYKVDFGTSGTTGYPCRDQMGYTSTGGVGDSQMVAYPSLFANNKRNGVEVEPYIPSTDTFTGCGGTTLNDNHIVKDRDFCHHATTLPATCNSIATTYTGYDYPHPLTGGGGESDTTDPILSAWFPTTQQTCSADPQTISIGITSSDQNITTCKWDTSTAAYADLTNTFDGAASGTVNHTDSASFACGVTHTIYYACQDAEGNTTDTASYTFSLPALLDETTPVITNVTSSTQAVALVQKLSITTSVAGTCRYCVNGVDGCASDTAWASRTAFSVTGGETTHHEVSITQAASSSATYNVICQNTQGTATSANSAITITTDAAKAITAGAGSLSITQGSGSLSVTILP